MSRTKFVVLSRHEDEQWHVEASRTDYKVAENDAGIIKDILRRPVRTEEQQT
jgi:hypothetical protein